MKRTLLSALLASVLVMGGLSVELPAQQAAPPMEPKSAQAKLAKEKYQEELQKLEDYVRGRQKELREQYAKELDEARKAALTKEDLEEAERIIAAKRALLNPRPPKDEFTQEELEEARKIILARRERRAGSKDQKSENSRERDDSTKDRKSAKQPVRVLSASWGAGDRQANVTDKVARLLAQGKTVVVDWTMLGRDPAPNVPKRLYLKVQIGDKVRSLEIPDRGEVRLVDGDIQVTPEK